MRLGFGAECSSGAPLRRRTVDAVRAGDGGALGREGWRWAGHGRRSDRTPQRGGLGLRVATGSGLLALIAFAGCGLSGPSSAPSSISPSTTAASMMPSDSVQGAETWGPLAVVPGEDSADTARTEGVMRITDTCTFLAERGGPVLLLWPADRASWDAVGRTITFENFDGTTVTVRDEDIVALGGGGGSSSESGVSVDVWLAQTHWVAQPPASCPLDPYWRVGDVRR